MTNGKQELTDQAVAVLRDRLHLVEVKANGHIRVNGCDFWCTTGKWYNPKNGDKGDGGLRSFILMLEAM